MLETRMQRPGARDQARGHRPGARYQGPEAGGQRPGARRQGMRQGPGSQNETPPVLLPPPPHSLCTRAYSSIFNDDLAACLAACRRIGSHTRIANRRMNIRSPSDSSSPACKSKTSQAAAPMAITTEMTTYAMPTMRHLRHKYM